MEPNWTLDFDLGHIHDDKGEIVCYLAGGPTERSKLNGQLIAAAPELLIALDELLTACADGIRRYHAGDTKAMMSNLISATMVQAEAAYRKAKGE